MQRNTLFATALTVIVAALSHNTQGAAYCQYDKHFPDKPKQTTKSEWTDLSTLVVNPESGSNQNGLTTATALHTNFRLSGSGEFLAQRRGSNFKPSYQYDPVGNRRSRGTTIGNPGRTNALKEAIVSSYSKTRKANVKMRSRRINDHPPRPEHNQRPSIKRSRKGR